MSAKTDKKIDDKLAKQSTKRKNKLAKDSARRKNKFNRKIAKKDKVEAIELFRGAHKDLGTARSEIASALARVTQSNDKQAAADLLRTQAANKAVQSELSNISAGNDASNMAELSKNGLAAVGTLKSDRAAQLNSLIAKLQGEQAESTLQRMHTDANMLGTGYASINQGTYKQMLQNHLNKRNKTLNEVNRDLSDSYDQSKFDLRENLAANQASLKDTLAQNQATYDKQRAAEREAERAAAARSIRGGGYGFGGYGFSNYRSRGSSYSLGSNTTSAPRRSAPKTTTRSEAYAKNLERLRTGQRGGYWAQPGDNYAIPWNYTIN